MVLNASVVSGRDGFRADLLSHGDQLIKFEMIVTEAAWDRRAAGKVVLHERSNHFTLEPFLVVDNVVGNPDLLSHPAGIIDVVERATAPLNRFRHAGMRSQAAL